MKLHSFRLRIALLSVLLAGGALVGFGMASWLLIYKTKLTRLDGEIKSQLIRESGSFRPVTHWQPYQKILPSIFGTDSQTAIALLVINTDGKTIHQSDNWPSELNPTTLFPQLPGSARSLFLPPPPFPPGQGEPPNSRFGEPPPEDLQRGAEPLRPPPPAIIQSSPSGTWRLGMVTSPHVQIAIAVSLQVIDREMEAIRNVFLISIPGALILVAVSAWWLSERALKPLYVVTASIRRVTAKGLDQRLPIADVDVEFVELLQVFNQMMERLERSFTQASRFSGDAAHELKTPLAILQGQLERTLQEADQGSELQQNLSNLLDEVGRLGAIVRKLLLLSLADAGQMRLHLVEVNLSQVLADLAEDIEMLAPDLEVKMQIAPALRIRADRDLLIQILHNLIANAIKYNLPSGWVQIAAQRQKDTISVTVSNSSQDISVGDRERIFDRFHRGDSARNRQIEGLGLGLSLSREIARAHGGDLKLVSAAIGQTEFILILPIR